MEQELSEIRAYDNGELMDLSKVKKALLRYFELSSTEQHLFYECIEDNDIREKCLKLIEKESKC